MGNCIQTSADTPRGGFFVPGTCVATAAVAAGDRAGQDAVLSGPQTDTTVGAEDGRRRDETLRRLYAERALSAVGRLLGAVDRNPYHRTYGCLDRQFWHYRTAAFASEMYQEGALALALGCTADVPGNRWFGSPRVRELATAAIRFAADNSHADGSCDDYYPFERALGAAVFSLQAAARAYQVLGLEDPLIVDWLRRRARWIIANNESGRLANHHALAALGLWRVGEISGEDRYRRAAEDKIAVVLDWQHEEGWFEEYGGADPGYQTVTIDSLAKIRRGGGDAALDEPLRRAVSFAREFLHPDGSYSGEYGSRGTYHFYPHGMELLAADCPPAAADAAALADGFLESLARGTASRFDDDRLFTHQAANLFEAYLDWAPLATAKKKEGRASADGIESGRHAVGGVTFFPAAQILVHRDGGHHTVISAARGGAFKHFDSRGNRGGDAGLIVETADGRIAVSQRHHLGRKVDYRRAAPVSGLVGCDDKCGAASLSVSGPLHWVRHETLGPLKQAAFHAGMCLAGRWCRGLVRRLLQKRLITGLSASGIHLTRCFEFRPTDAENVGNEKLSSDGCILRVIDTIELTDQSIKVRRMSLGSDHQTAYVAACGVYQDSVLTPWTDLGTQIERLNAERRITILREL